MQIQLKVSTEILRKQSEEIRCSLQEIKQDWDEIRTIVTGSKTTGKVSLLKNIRGG